MTEDKEYLGDGVYIGWEPQGQMMVLTAEDGTRATNTIYLEYEVVDALLAYVAQHRLGRRSTKSPPGEGGDHG